MNTTRCQAAQTVALLNLATIKVKLLDQLNRKETSKGGLTIHRSANGPLPSSSHSSLENCELENGTMACSLIFTLMQDVTTRD